MSTINNNTNFVAKIINAIVKYDHDRKAAAALKKFKKQARKIRKVHSVAVIELVEPAPETMKLVRVVKEQSSGKVLVRATSTKVVVTRERSNDLVASAPKTMQRSRILDASVPRGSISPRN
ncbi:hypothetical protein E24_00200 [Faustovirus]|nr:hypothetical protein PRJ_Fausto_00184 [Faustovirus]AMN83130.1 hypothetical protein E24_00200 [Faustovirus]AMN85099.1 hypothetical protein E23_00199 [Faustovirus]QBR99096.1 hypothetical protein [Faustovirus mariensis]